MEYGELEQAGWKISTISFGGCASLLVLGTELHQLSRMDG